MTGTATDVARLAVGGDGSLEIVLSHDQPPATASGGEPVNWLPVPEGEFVMMLRLYLPGPAVLDGNYVYPPIEHIDTPAEARHAVTLVV